MVFMNVSRNTTLHLSEFIGRDIKLNYNVIEIDGKRYLYRGTYIIEEIDIENQVVYKKDESSIWFQEPIPFSQVSLIPLFKTEEN